jgi:hypothetical protein
MDRYRLSLDSNNVIYARLLILKGRRKTLMERNLIKDVIIKKMMARVLTDQTKTIRLDHEVDVGVEEEEIVEAVVEEMEIVMESNAMKTVEIMVDIKRKMLEKMEPKRKTNNRIMKKDNNFVSVKTEVDVEKAEEEEEKEEVVEVSEVVAIANGTTETHKQTVRLVK